MRLRASALLALSSVTFASASLLAATRPHYGGTLHVQLTTALPDPAKSPLVAETLFRMDQRGVIQPLLARTWSSDSARKRWRFAIRSKVVFHDGTPLDAAAVAASLEPRLKQLYPDLTFAANGQSLIVQCARPIPDLLDDLSRPEFAVSRSGAGTGPFRVSKWEPPHHGVLTANDDYWHGRPFLDSVEFTVGPLRPNSSAEFQELPVTLSRRAIPEGLRVWKSSSASLLALYLAATQQQPLHDALSLSIDRASIVNVLLQRRGESATGLLPQWLTGYEFVFPQAHDAARAREIAAPLKLPALSLSTPPGDALARAVADRIVVNARDAGIVIQFASQSSNANLQLLHLALSSTNAALDLRDWASQTGLADRIRDKSLNAPDGLYDAERALLDDSRIIPLVHVPQVFGIHPRVQNWDEEANAIDPLANLVNVWLKP
ncbi:MAG TPA: ABC transporter substrate-binding protein [Bryobacteraceae bacterium]|nr:ABC transporter substrate-binding protein [Bryobacteraceae bacterium]